MAKGIKKIKWTGKGKVFQSKSNLSSRMVIPPDEFVWFKVIEWLPGTTEDDKKKDISWIWQEHDRKTIIWKKIIPANKIYAIKLPKKLCGSYSYYLEASLSGKTDANLTGLYINGLCEKSIVSSKWSTSNGGSDVRKTQVFSYGNIVHLNLETEGLNGDTLKVEIYNIQNLRSDKLIFTYTNVKVRDGEVNLEIKNTSTWQGLVSNIQEEEKFYIKVKDQVTDKYILDSNKDEEHGRFLRIKNKLVANNPEPPQNNTAAKTGQPNVKAVRYEPCKFETISITETQKKDGKMEQTKTLVFDNGKGLKNVVNPEKSISKTIFFGFDSDVITKEGNEKLNNTLNFLLEHEHSIITIDGYACVIGKMQYNQSLSQRRSDAVRKFFVDGKLDTRRIISNGKGEISASDNKSGADNIKYKDEKIYQEARRVDISFKYFGHSAQTIIYETIAPSQDKDVLIDITAFQTNACFREQDKHKKQIKVTSTEYKQPKVKEGSSFAVPVHSALATWNVAPLQYIWPRYNLVKGASGNGVDAAENYNVFIHSCRYFSDTSHATILIKAYPDIKWELEFKWNHKESFAYSFGNKLHPHDIKTGKEKAIGSIVDGAFSKSFGEMSQSFELSLKSEWDEKSQKQEFGKEFGEKIAKTLAIFNKIKSMTETISNSPLAKGKIMFEIKSPVIAFSAEWYLERAKEGSLEIATIVVIGVSAKPLVEAEFTINIFKLFIEMGGNAICPGAGTIITWVIDKLGSNAGIHFLIIFSGGIYVDGKVTLNTSYPKETKGEVKATGKVQVVIEFKAWAKAGSANIGVDGVVKADVNTSVSGGVKVGADKKGIYSSPVAEFGGIKATFVAAATVKFGILKRTFSYDGESILVEPNEIKFNKYYLDL